MIIKHNGMRITSTFNSLMPIVAIWQHSFEITEIII